MQDEKNIHIMNYLNILEAILKEADGLTRRFYHGSSVELKPAFILGGRKFQSNFGDVEKILEIFKPAGMNGRLDSVYIVSKPSDVYSAGGQDNYIYLVEPMDEPQPHNQGWLSKIYNLAMINSDKLTKNGPILKSSTIKKMLDEVKPHAENYWSGKKFPGGLQEFICKRAKVIKEVKVR